MSIQTTIISASLTASTMDISLVLELIQSILPNLSNLLSYSTFCNYLTGMYKLKQLGSIWSSMGSLKFSSVSGQEHETFY